MLLPHLRRAVAVTSLFRVWEDLCETMGLTLACMRPGCQRLVGNRLHVWCTFGVETSLASVAYRRANAFSTIWDSLWRRHPRVLVGRVAWRLSNCGSSAHRHLRQDWKLVIDKDFAGSAISLDSLARRFRRLPLPFVARSFPIRRTSLGCSRTHARWCTISASAEMSQWMAESGPN